MQLNTTTNVYQAPSSVDGYIRHGWSLITIPPGSKGPRTPGWQLRENALKSQADLPVGHGIGLAHAYSGTMALDIDDWDDACALLGMQGVDLQALYDAPDSVIIDSGRAGHGKLLYALPAPLTTKRVIVNGKTLYELRCASASGHTVQDVLPPSQHPSGSTYRWSGNGHWSRLPPIPDTLMTLWTGMLDQDTQREIKVSGESVSASWSEIRSAVEAIPASCTRDEWITVGMALHWAGSQTGQVDQGLHIWNDWSKNCPEKYPGEGEIWKQWNSFRPQGRTLGSLFHIARENGWVRPPIDASALFRSIGVTEPAILIQSLSTPAPDPDLDLWPPVLVTRAKEVAETVACDPLVPLMAGLAAACGAVNAQSRLELMPGFQVPPILWLMTIGQPAEKKTPGSKPMFTVLLDIEREDLPRHRKAMLEWEGKEAMYVSSKKAFIAHCASPEALLGSEPPDVYDLPPQPTPCRLIVNDTTSQKLVRLAAERPEGLVCVMDEMNGWLDKLADAKSGDDRSAWVISYEAARHTMDRVGAGTIVADNFALSLYGNIQPKVFRDHLHTLTKDGLGQRFIPVTLRPLPPGVIGQPMPEYMTTDAAYQSAIRLIYAQPKQVYRLCFEGFTLYREFQTWASHARHDAVLLNDSVDALTALGKIEGTAGRLIFMFHMLENPLSAVVSADTVRRALTVTQKFIVPSIRHALGNTDTGLERWLMDYVIQYADKDGFTMTQLKRSARRQIERLSTYQADRVLMDALVPLEDAGWITPIGQSEWIINPALRTVFAQHRQDVIEAKQRRMDEMYKDNPKDTVHRVYGA